MNNKNILISGAGIAGLALAYWLKRYGFNPTVIEKYPSIREGGYLIDFFGLGVDVAERMGILASFDEADVKVDELTFVNKNNNKVGGFQISKFKKLFKGRAYNLLRSSVAKIIYEHVKNDIEVLVGTSVSSINEGQEKLEVKFSDGRDRTFDLVIGADGLHSNIRNICFGHASLFEHWYGYYACSYTMDNFLGNNKLFLSYTQPDKQVGIYSLPDNKLATFFVFRPKHKAQFDIKSTDQQKEVIKNEFGDNVWYYPELIKRIDSYPDFYFDDVSQIKMNDWAKGRVSLVGDACCCPSLLSGQGTALAMVGAYILAGELKNSKGDYQIAYRKYQDLMKPLVEHKQKLAEKFAGSFVPGNQWGILLRNLLTNLTSLPFVSKWFFNQFLRDDLILENY